MGIKLLSAFDLRENPYQTRSDVSVCVISDLVRSIRLNGQDEPCEVYVDGDGLYTIFEGHRRVLACAALGRKVRCRVIKKPPESEILQTIYRRNTVRHNHRPGAVMIDSVWKTIQEQQASGKKVSFRRCAMELGISYKRLREIYALWKKLYVKDVRLAMKAVKERWSEPEIRVALGLPSQREHYAKRPWYGPMRPKGVTIHRDGEGKLWMSCLMGDDVDPELLKEYYWQKHWPEPVMDPSVEQPKA
jgi:hypothetical protein